MSDPIYQAPAPMIDEQYIEIMGEEMPMGCAHDWMLRPESDTYECLMCGAER